MAEEEKIREHAKHALQALTDRTKNWKDRIKDFIWEVFIIVVAVNITLWFHNWSDKRHEQAQVKDFLIDTRESLVQDTIHIWDYINFMTNHPLAYYDSVLSQIDRHQIDAQYIDSLYFQLTNNKGMEINYGIYQSFSSANNLRLIENRKLLSDIISLYTNYFPTMQLYVKQLYDRRSDGFYQHIMPKTGWDNSSAKLSTIIYEQEVINVFLLGENFIKEVNGNSEYIINQTSAVISEIDKELKDRFDYKVKNPNK